MTTEAIVHDTRVIKSNNRQPAAGHMASIALRRRRNMCRPLARGNHSIMAGRTDTQHLGMINRSGRYPACR